jgi:hypothetical protein
MKWLCVETIEELKKYGCFKEIRQEIKENLGEKISIKSVSWGDLLDAIQELRQFTFKANNIIFQSKSELSETSKTSLYFQSDAARIIYALLELDGEQRLRELGVNKSYTKDLEKAKNWRNNIAKKIHPDVCEHPNASEASIKLTKIYEQMTGK